MNQDTDRQIGVGRSVRCIKCDYDLQGLFINSDCPECGLPIDGSVFMVQAPAYSLQLTKMPKKIPFKRIAMFSGSFVIVVLLLYIMFAWLG